MASSMVACPTRPGILQSMNRTHHHISLAKSVGRFHVSRLFRFLNIRHLDCLGKETSAGLSVKFNNPLHGFGGPMNNDFLIQPNDQ